MDVTNCVKKSNPHYFDCGGSADIFEGCMATGDPSKLIHVAVKVFRARPDSEKKVSERIRRELRVLDRVKHRNVISFYGFSKNFDRPGALCFVFPFYQHGHIVKYLENNTHVDPIPLITQIADGLSYLHRIKVIHGDIKGTNVLIDDDGNARITDFGLARILEVNGFTTNTAKSSFRFMAPELISRGNEVDKVPLVTVATDTWAFAMLVIQITTRDLPFRNISQDLRVIFHISEGGRPERTLCQEVNDRIWNILEMCWDVDPNKRPPMQDLLEFFRSEMRHLEDVVG